jgi:hypothetical protein
MERADLEPNLEPMRKLPYVRDVQVTGSRRPESDGVLKVKTPSGVFLFTLEIKRNYLDRPLVGSLLTLHKELAKKGEPPLLLLARYVPRPIGERLLEAGLNFADQAGNLNLRLGDKYQATLLGNRDHSTGMRARKLSPTAVQVLFTLLATPEALNWRVRQLAEAAGIGKTAAAEIRQKLLEDHILVQSKPGAYQVADAKAARERFQLGYSQVLRPHLMIGRFRGPYRTPDAFVDVLQKAATERKVRWALSGGAGAYELERFYRGEQTVAFVSGLDPEHRKALKLLPDKSGPITLLKSFGSSLFWPHPSARPVAHPWLIYAELLNEGEPRALEAAEEIRKKYLNQ